MERGESKGDGEGVGEVRREGGSKRDREELGSTISHVLLHRSV